MLILGMPMLLVIDQHKVLKSGLVSQFKSKGQGKEKSAFQLIKEEISWEELIEQGLVVAGSPSTVVEQLKTITKDLRVGTIIAFQAVGSMPHHLAKKNLQLFAEEVKPHLEDIWSEWDSSEYFPKGFGSREKQNV